MKKLFALVILALCLALPAWAQEEGLEAVRAALTQALLKEANATSDPWAKFLLSQPVENLKRAGDQIAFSLPAWDPGAGGLDGEQDGWLMAMWQHIHQNVVDGQAQVVPGADGVAISDIKPFVKAVKEAAGHAKAQFDLPQVRMALTARLLPTQLYDQAGAPTPAFAALIKVYQGALTPQQLELALSAQKSPSLGVTGGPEKLRLVFYSGAPSALAKEALKDAQAQLAATDLANQMTDGDIAQAFAHAFAARGESFRGGGAKGEKRALDLNLQQMMTQSLYLDDFVAYAKDMSAAFDQLLPGLIDQVRQMPDYPLREQPPTGLLFSASDQDAGTLVILRAQDDGAGRYLVLKDNKGQVALTAFLRSGQSCQVYLPQGQYTVLCAKGQDWYGPVKMFDQAGEYAASGQPVTVLDDTHYHTITLGGEDDLPVRGAQPDEFVGKTQREGDGA